jgi:hypothetical protein
MESNEFKHKITEIVSQEYKIEFLGDNFDKIISQLSETKIEKICAWIQEVIGNKIRPILKNDPHAYKNWHANQLLVFRYPINIDDNEYRILLVKVKNSFYIEFHFGDHKYYDDIRKELRIK